MNDFYWMVLDGLMTQLSDNKSEPSAADGSLWGSESDIYIYILCNLCNYLPMSSVSDLKMGS